MKATPIPPPVDLELHNKIAWLWRKRPPTDRHHSPAHHDPTADEALRNLDKKGAA